MNRTFDLLWLRVREYFKHPAEDIRQARPIIPGRLYYNFGHICKAVPLSMRERLYLDQSENHGALPIELLRDIHPGSDSLNQIRQLEDIDGISYTELPARCNLCAFYHNGLPCPIYNLLADNTVVCDSHKYIILKKQ